MNVVLISTYELGRQPFGLASPAAWLRACGARVTCLDLSRQSLEERSIRAADLVAFYLPMHTATRLAVELLAPVRELNPRAHICFYGLYAPMNEAYLRELGAKTILGGEFEAGLAQLVQRLAARRDPREPQREPVISRERQEFLLPERAGMVPLKNYAHLIVPGERHRIVGYTEASRGCKHLCRHCPVVPVYQGAFRIVQRDVVLADIRQQVAAGAEHITFGDPDFFNGVGHALAIVESLHREFPWLTYDATIKIEHLLQQARHLPALRDTGCLFVTSAAESVDDTVLERLAKDHTCADFIRVVALLREAGLPLQPTFVPFTPWTTLESYRELLCVIRDLDLVESVSPIQLGIRLLIPAGSRLLELSDVREQVGLFDRAALVYPWRNSDARVDGLCEQVQDLVRAGDQLMPSRSATFRKIWRAAAQAAGITEVELPPQPALLSRAAIPYLNEPWYC